MHYLHRVGLDHAKKLVLDDADNRKALYQRLLHSLAVEQDPWIARAKQGVEKHEFQPLNLPEATVPA